MNIVRCWNRIVRPVVFVGTMIMAASVQALVYPDEIQKVLDQWDNDHVRIKGFAEVDDTASLFDDAWYASLDGGKASGSVFLPGADLDPVGLSVRMLEHREAALPHVRYRVTYRAEFVTPAGDQIEPRAYIEVLRFNLGPARRAELVAELEGVPIAAEEVFGVGPHVAWRFVVGAVQGRNAHVFRASRKELTEAEARLRACFEQTCLSLDDVQGADETGWQTIAAPELGERANVPADADGARRSPGAIASEMFAEAMGDGYGEPVEGLQPGEVPVTLVISRDVGGQDSHTSAVLHQTHLMDDALAELWTRRLQFDETVQWEHYPVYRPGRQ